MQAFSRLVVVSTVLSAALCSLEASGQEWARKMFETTTHDFGVVAKDATTTFDFTFTNSYVEDIHVSSVRASCGCTTPVIVKGDVKTWEKGVIRAVFNTDTFTGKRAATVTVTFDKPFRAEVQLRVTGTIRSDLVFEPGEIEFGSVDQGVASQQRIGVTAFGKTSWRIQDVRSVNGDLTVQILDEKRQGGKVRYELAVSLKPSATPGYLQDQLTIVTNDASLTNVPIPVTGRVVSSLTVSPQSVHLGDLRPGEVSTKNVVVKSKVPCRIAAMTCDDGSVTAQFDPQKEATLHVIPITFTAPESGGKMAERLTIRTEAGATATCDLSATILEPLTQAAVETESPTAIAKE